MCTARMWNPKSVPRISRVGKHAGTGGWGGSWTFAPPRSRGRVTSTAVGVSRTKLRMQLSAHHWEPRCRRSLLKSAKARGSSDHQQQQQKLTWTCLYCFIKGTKEIGSKPGSAGASKSPSPFLFSRPPTDALHCVMHVYTHSCGENKLNQQCGRVYC